MIKNLLLSWRGTITRLKPQLRCDPEAVLHRLCQETYTSMHLEAGPLNLVQHRILKQSCNLAPVHLSYSLEVVLPTKGSNRSPAFHAFRGRPTHFGPSCETWSSHVTLPALLSCGQSPVLVYQTPTQLQCRSPPWELAGVITIQTSRNIPCQLKTLKWTLTLVLNWRLKS